VPSHCAPETHGSIHEGGELGYSLLHAFGAALVALPPGRPSRVRAAVAWAVRSPTRLPQATIDLILELCERLVSKGLDAGKGIRQCCRGSNQQRFCGYTY
jgi:hypothetical protein